MKRIISVMLLSVLLLASCAPAVIEVDVTAAAATLRGGVTFEDVMSDMDTAGICRILALTEDEVVQAAGYVSTGATAEEFFVIEVQEGKVEAVQKAMDAHMDYMIEGYSDYGPHEVPKLKNAVRDVIGNYVFLCVCNDPSQAKAIIDQIVGK